MQIGYLKLLLRLFIVNIFNKIFNRSFNRIISCSLIDLDKLKKDSKKGSNSPRSALSKKKTNAAKQEEDSLMDHLKKVENGEFHENIQDDDYENSNSATKLQTTFATTAELMMEADDAVKKNLLNSDSDIGNCSALVLHNLFEVILSK